MVKSMTGFGRAEGETKLGRLSIEARSVNHRYCDINIKLSKRFTPFETRIKETIRSEVSRGRVDVSLKLDTAGEGKVQFDVDLTLADQYYKALQILKKHFKLKEDITLGLLAGAKDLITIKEELEEVEPYWREISPILKQSLKEMDQMKCQEGESLVNDFKQRLQRINRELEAIKQQFPLRLEAYRNRLRERVQSLLGETEIEVSRFEQEVALLAERMDITEEVVRMESHLGQFATLLNEEEPIGRKMDFLLQEIYREVNTISAKANDAEISQRVVEVKSELEKIREQVQNIE